MLVEDPEKSYHAASRKPGDIFDNKLIFGDNLLALKALEAEYTGKVKCIFIDPPYNTGSAFTHYDDGVEHSLWLSLMRDRLEILRKLLSEDGSLWVTLDDNEAHYFKVLADEVFGRTNFIASNVWQKNYSPKSSARHISVDHDYVLVYARDAVLWTPNLMPRSDEQDKAYKNPDKDPRGPWKPGDLSARNPYSLGIYPITTPGGREISGPPKGTYWRVSKSRLADLDADGRIWWGKDGNNVPALKRFLTDVKQGLVPQTLWTYQEVGHTQDAKKEIVALFGNDVFGTPKPERLMARVLELATNPGDLVLDSFAGSGTTGAVAQKMNRRWILIELGDHCHTHIIPRLRKVIDNQDPGGVTESTGWSGGGGFRYYRLAPSLLKRDKWGQWVVNPEFNPEVLAESVCKLEGYTYAPSPSTFWQHGKASESAWIYVTTAVLSEGQLRELSADVGPDRSLLVCCGAWLGKASEFDNLTLKKIPKAMLACCEYDRDDYSLNVGKLPLQDPDREPRGDPRARPVSKTKASKAKKDGDNSLGLFPDEGEA